MIITIITIVLLELGLNFGRVDVGVEICHDGENDTHCNQERGKEDILCPLWKRKETIINQLLTILLTFVPLDITLMFHFFVPVWEALQAQPQSVQ